MNTEILTEKDNLPGTRKVGITALSMVLPVFVILAFLFSVPLVFLGELSVAGALFATVTVEILTVFIVLAIASPKGVFKEYLRLKNFSWKNALLGAGLGVVLFVFMQVLSISLSAIFGGVESSDTSISILSQGGVLGVILIFVMVPFVVPMAEELLFRGLLLRSVAISFKKDSRVSTFVAIAVSSIVFGLAHSQGFSDATDFFIIFGTTIMASTMAFFVIKMDSLWVSYFAHSSYNLVTVVIFSLISY